MLNGTLRRISSFLLLLLCVVISGGAQNRGAEFISLEQARPVLNAFPDEAARGLQGKIDASAWSKWVRLKDREIRNRLRRGEEDTITNLLRSGVTFTNEPQIDRQALQQFGVNPAVNSAAERRADDLIRALASPKGNEGIIEARSLLAQEGYTFGSARKRARLKKHLLANLARMRDEFQKYRQIHQTAGLAERSHLYEQRGISLDSNLWPDYALDRALRELVKNGLLKPGSVTRVAIVGPGLDFANKDYGNDFYPPQTIQPFAVLDSLARLGLVNLRTVETYTFDISPNVNIHLRRAARKAASGKPYIVQLPWDSRVPFNQDYLAGFTQYWQSLGDQIGSATKPVPVPAEVARDLHIRAVRIRPQVVTRITPVDMNIVFERLAGKKFDLIIGTNIFIYYDAFQQSLARANLASMLNPGGMVLTNDMLAGQVPSKLKEVQRTNINVMGNGAIADHVFCYRRE